jgi:Dictyostelium (slime mold) repeat
MPSFVQPSSRRAPSARSRGLLLAASLAAALAVVLAACSHATSEQTAEEELDQQALELACNTPYTTVVLKARRNWSPSRRVEGKLKFSPARAFVLPASIAVTAGNADNKRVKFEFEGPGAGDATCTYRGGASSPSPITPADAANGSSYLFERCSNGLTPGATFVAKEVELEVQGGDTQLPSTAVAMTLAPSGCAADGGASDADASDADAGATLDSGRDAGVDAAADADVDSGHDAGVDAGAQDAGVVDAGAADAGPRCTTASCNDGNPCNGVEVCNANGTCTAGTPPVLDDGNACTIDACNPATGVTHTPAPAGTACVDSNACNGAETCNGAGACVAGAPLVVDDGNPCTADSCDPVRGVQNTPMPAGTACADSNLCNGAETCNATGQCQSGAPLVVDDGNPCTADSCDPVRGVQNTPMPAGTACADSNLCNGAETCNATGQCQSGAPLVVDDGNPCTADSCDPVRGVQNTPVPAGTACADSNLCNGAETCNATGQCQSGAPLVVDDGNPCTADSCDPVRGVQNTAVAGGVACSDGNACNGEELCNGTGACAPGLPLDLDDGNPCTVDACSEAGGVTHTPISTGTGCGDNNACNGAEVCNAAGQCQAGTPPVVDDGNVCTVDACDATAGVTHVVDRTKPGCEGDPLVETVYEPAASVFGRVVDATGAPRADYTIEAFDFPSAGQPRSDVVFSKAADGSFRFRLTSIPDTRNENTAPAHVVLKFTAGTALPAAREVYLHAGELQTVGTVALVEKDPRVTVIGPAGGTARDSSGEYEVVIPAGAIDRDIPVQITPFRKREHFTVPLPDSTVTMYGFDLSPDGTKFATPITVRIANTLSIPTTFRIPMGTASIDTGRWEHEAFATWNGSKWEAQITHFSPHDCNLSPEGVWKLSITESNDPEVSVKGCFGSSVGLANGVFNVDVGLPSTLGAFDYSPQLVYTSSMAGRFAPRAPRDDDSRNGSFPPGSVKTASPPVVKLVCSSADARDEGAPRGRPNSCTSNIGGGRCSLGTVQAFPLPVRLRSESASSETEASAETGEVGVLVEPWLAVPGNDTVPTFQTQRLTLGFSGGKACVAGNGGAFGVREGSNTFGDVNTDPAPISIKRPVFVPHAMNSPFGRGWGFQGISRLYVDPTHSEHVVLGASGVPEYFRPRMKTFPVIARQNAAHRFARDPVTAQIFVTDTGNGIRQIAEVTANNTLVPRSTLAFVGDPSSLAITYVDGVRHFLVALDDRSLYDVTEGGASRLLKAASGTPSPWPTDAPTVAAFGAQAVFVTARIGDQASQLYSFDLTEAAPTAVPLLGAANGSPTIDPGAFTLGSLKFSQPRGLAFTPDGSLYITDRPRHVMFRVRPSANGTIAVSSSVERVLGDGAAQTGMPLGVHLPARDFALPLPLDVRLAPDGLV